MATGSKLFNVSSRAGSEETQCPYIYARDRDIAVPHLMHRIEKSAIPPERYDHFRPFPCSLEARLPNEFSALLFKHRLNAPCNQRIANAR